MSEPRTSSRFPVLARAEVSVLCVSAATNERDLIAAILERDPVTRYLLTTCSHGAEALALVRERNFDCLLIDSHLPDGTATELLEQLTKIVDLATLPVVVATDSERDSYIEAIFRAGAVDFISKERVSGSDLCRTLRFAVERARFQNMRSQLARSQRLMSLGQVAASVAHEINNPAAFILANLLTSQDTLRGLVGRSSEFSPDVVKRLTDLASATQDNIDGIRRIAAIVEEMRVLSHPRTDAVEMVDLSDVVRIAVKLLGKKLDTADSLVFELPNMPQIAADRGRLIQVFINLLDNAQMALRDQPRGQRMLRVVGTTEPDFVELTVYDSGCGMAPSIAARAFEPFFTTKSEGQGTGLGLSICAEYVHLHSGEISLESELGKGTTVTVRLPLQTGLQPRSERLPLTLHPPDDGGRVVIIDDEAPLLRAFSRVLAGHHQVITFERARDALTAILGGLHPEAILCDVNMPDLDGPGLYRELEEVSPNLARRVIFVTGGSFTANARKLLLDMGVEVLAKPVEQGPLLQAIEKVRRAASTSAGESVA